MALLQELDTGTPIRTGEPTVTLTIDGRKVSVPPGTSVMAAAALIDNPIPKLCATDSVEAFGSCRLCLVEIEGRKGTPASCTTPAEAGMIVRTKTPRLERLRRGVMELYISDHPLDCLTCSANNDCELQAQAGNVGLRDVRYGYDGANHLKAPTDASNPYFTFESSKVHRLLALRARLRRSARHVRADNSRPRIRLEGWNGRRRFPLLRMRILRRLRAGLPDRDAQRKAGHRKGNARAHGRDDLRLLRRRLLVQGGAQGRRSPAHGPLQGRQGERGPFVRQGPVRLWLRDPQGPCSEADDPRADRGSMARSLLGRRDRVCGERVQTHSGEVWARFGWRDQFLALHQRGSVPGSEDGSRRIRQQQYRHLRARLPLADRLRPVQDLSAPRPARRISSPSKKRTSWS